MIKNLPALYPSNICFKSIGSEQRSWASLSTQYEWITVIDYIHEDLHNLGIISADFKTIKSRKEQLKMLSPLSANGYQPYLMI